MLPASHSAIGTSLPPTLLLSPQQYTCYPTITGAASLAPCYRHLSNIHVILLLQVLLASHPAIGTSVFAVVALIAAGCAFALPIETKGRNMLVSG